MAFKLLAVKGEVDAYYLQSGSSPDEYVSWKEGGWYLRVVKPGAGYEKLPVRFSPLAGAPDTYEIYDALPGHKFAKFVSFEGDKIFSLHDIGKGHKNGVIEGIKLVDLGGGSNNVFKIELLNNGKFFNKDYGDEFRA